MGTEHKENPYLLLDQPLSDQEDVLFQPLSIQEDVLFQPLSIQEDVLFQPLSIQEDVLFQPLSIQPELESDQPEASCTMRLFCMGMEIFSPRCFENTEM